jgi:hypothetical protein
MNNTENKTHETPIPNKRVTRGRSTHVRLTEAEYRRLQNDRFVSGESIPTLLKASYFRRSQLVPLMNADDARALMIQLSRLGNNVNQIARHLNSGFREGWNDAFQKLCADLAEIRLRIAGIQDGERERESSRYRRQNRRSLEQKA